MAAKGESSATIGEWVAIREYDPTRAAETLTSALQRLAPAAARRAGLRGLDVEELATDAASSIWIRPRTAERVDPEKSLHAWLNGVLANVARQKKRVEARAARDPTPPAPDSKRRLEIARSRAEEFALLGPDPYRAMTELERHAVSYWLQGASFAVIAGRLPTTTRRESAFHVVQRALAAARGSTGTRREFMRTDYPALTEPDLAQLGPRQREVYPLLRDGISLTAIAERLNLRLGAVNCAAQRIRQRLGLTPMCAERARRGPTAP